MKKIVSLLVLTLILAIAMCSCGEIRFDQRFDFDGRSDRRFGRAIPGGQ